MAHAVKEWALAKGATHFCHWFQPQTGLTAEKHDAFLTFDDDGRPMERFSGAQLIQSEPDACSFPSGGMRTHLRGPRLHGLGPEQPDLHRGRAEREDALRALGLHQLPRRRARQQDAAAPLDGVPLGEGAGRAPALRRHHVLARVVPTLGAEQEYFLIDRAFYALRPDLVTARAHAHRGQPPKGQELEDHYFGSIKDRILAFMQEAENELYKLGIPIKTRHNEVAPSQYETAPIFEEANVASDHNQMVMETMGRVARRHNLALLLHEKPFAGINGSGKHCNWSLMDSEGQNLLEPGATPESNLQFLVFLTATLKGVHRRAGLLRAGIASSGNDHRLGANEAPPAIISVFLGEQLTRVLDAIEKGETPRGRRLERISLGIREAARGGAGQHRPQPHVAVRLHREQVRVPRRAVGGRPSPCPIAFLNAAVAEALGEFEAAIQARQDKGAACRTRCWRWCGRPSIETKAIRFEGNNYAAEWVEEADRRGPAEPAHDPGGPGGAGEAGGREFLAEAKIFSEAGERGPLPRQDGALHQGPRDRDRGPEEPGRHPRPARRLQAARPAGRRGRRPVREGGPGAGGQAGGGPGWTHGRPGRPPRTRPPARSTSRSRRASWPNEVVPAMAARARGLRPIEETVADEFWTLPKYREMLLLV